MNEFLTVENLSFNYGKNPVLNNINFQLNRGQIATLLGPSGCGKTSLLRLIAGFLSPLSGQIKLNDQVISSPNYVLSPEKRGLGMVFQDYALFPHLSIFHNIAFGLNANDKKTAAHRVAELLEMVGLPHYEKRFPHELSGGEQQRIAIARALAPKPKLLLMDEPFASLDTNLRERLVRSLGDLLKHLDISAILVTHDQREAFAVSEYIGLMNEGKILHWDKPYQIYHEPKSHFVANFVGQGVMIKAQITDTNKLTSALGEITHHRDFSQRVGTWVCMLIRPDDIVVDPQSDLSATVVRKFFHGPTTLYELDYQGVLIVANFTSHADYQIGEVVNFSIDAEHLVTFDHEQELCVC